MALEMLVEHLGPGGDAGFLGESRDGQGVGAGFQFLGRVSWG